jgi:hypothetical protein
VFCVLLAAEVAAAGDDAESKPAEGVVAFTPPNFAELFKGSSFFATSSALVEGAKVRATHLTDWLSSCSWDV